jgi:transposase-like protein
MEKKQKKRMVKPLKRIGTSYPEEVKRKVVGEIESGFHSHRAAAKLYGISRNTVNDWVIQYSLLTLNSLSANEEFMAKSDGNSTIRLLNRQVIELKRALEKSKLKVDALETMIKVSEEELKIKIRKKPGVKQSKE